MGILNDFKRLLFGAKSVTKSAADKAVESGKETAQKVAEEAEELTNKAFDKLEDVGSKALDKAEETWEKIKDKAEDIGEKLFDKQQPPAETPPVTATPVAENPTTASTIPEAPQEQTFVEQIGEKVIDKAGEGMEKAKSIAEKVGEKVLDYSEKASEKVMDFSEEVGAKVIDKAGDIWEKTKEISESIGGKIMDSTSGMVDKAKEAVEHPKETLDTLIDKAGKAVDDLETKLRNKAGDMDEKVPTTPHTTGEGLFEKHDDFFSKAKKYAEGDHHAFDANPSKSSNPDATTQNNPVNTDELSSQEKNQLNHLLISGDQPKEESGKTSGTIKGFDDHDGDGDFLIDDAIVDDEK